MRRYATSVYILSVQSVSVMMQNNDGGNRGIHVEHNSVHQPWRYLNGFQVTANRMKKAENCTKPFISEVSKNATQKRSTHLKRAEKILRIDISGI